MSKLMELLNGFFQTPQDGNERFIQFRTFDNGVDGGDLSEDEFIEMCQLVVTNLKENTVSESNQSILLLTLRTKRSKKKIDELIEWNFGVCPKDKYFDDLLEGNGKDNVELVKLKLIKLENKDK